ncbi:TonB-dependent receptor [Croceicoccus estronivorus]|uniref:TonB-dependent receptor n=1 Tax=Croceicoccus estronivorus TaxID=1172626 RepID=UPI0008370610|nr:TonB-dependent receptor [Croceicoccus estronivorus]OCC22455.1 TonB-dependent receptor [Croceicoccus estronivorus]
MRILTRYGAISLAALAFSQAAYAQDGNAPQADTTSQGLQDIVVTARRSSESLQSVPVAVTALSGEFLERQNVTDATSLPRLAPSLTIEQQPSSLSAASIFIRGIGNNEPSAVSEQGVGVYLDGVYLARAAGAVFDLLDLERVEVLRGPQGTLFGRNTIGGALQLVSKKPTDEFHATAKAGFARYNDWYVRSRIDTGYIGNSPIKASISAQHREANGYTNNTLTPSSKDPGSLNADTLAVALQADLSDLTINYNFDYDHRRGTPAFFQMVATTPSYADYFGQSESLGGAPFVVDTVRRQDVQQAGFVDRKGNYRYDSITRVQGHSLTLSYEAMPELTIKSITGYRKFFQDTTLNLTGNGTLKGVVLDFDSPTLTSVQTVVPYTGNNAPQKQHQFSQEFQALGTAGDFSYLFGLYYFYEKASEYNRQALTAVLPVSALAYAGFEPETADAVAALNPGLENVGLNLFPVQAFGGTAKSKAVFGQVSWKPSALDEKLELTLGGRYTSDKKTIYLAGDVNPVLRGKVKYDNFSWLASLSYKFSRDVMAYARVSTGYRSGGINPRASVINTFEPEKATSYEVGIKSELFDRRVRLNLAAYITDYDNLQIQQFAAGSAGATSLIVNAGKVQLKGFEAEAAIMPLPGLTIDGSVGHVDTNYKTFLFRDPNTNDIVDVADIAKPAYTARWTARIGGEFEQPLGDATARLRVDYSYRTSMYVNALDLTTPFNENIKSPPDNNLRARLSIEDIQLGGSTLEIGVWGDNLTNEKILVYGIDFGSLGFAGATFKKPRTYGVDAKISF